MKVNLKKYLTWIIELYALINGFYHNFLIELTLPEDLECGPQSTVAPLTGILKPPITEIVPVYRRDCHLEVYAGSHQYPGEGVYLLKFDNSYSMWRSKTLYYRVYYTR